MRTAITIGLLVSAALSPGCQVTRSGGDAGPPAPDARLRDTPPDVPPDAPPRACTDPGETLGAACDTTAECADGCFCNGIELCMGGTCVAGALPCDDEISCTTDACRETDHTCTFETDDTSCSDGDLCNGAERCVVGAGCRPGLRPSCADGDPCTVGRCEPATGCVFEVRDLDLDGYPDERCGGDDCNDDPLEGGTVNPGAPEVCGNGLDDDCDGRLDFRETECTATNDTCETAEILPGPGTYVRTTRGTAPNYVLGCRPLGFDAVFRFTVATSQDVQAQLEVDGALGSVTIRRADACATGPDFVCGDSTVLARDLAPGDYYAIVKTSTATSFSLRLDFLPATPIQPTDVCDPTTTLDATAGGTFTGFYADARDDYDLSCRVTSTAFREVALRLVVTAPSDLHVTARSMGSGTVSTYLSLTRDCTSASGALACVQSSMADLRRRSLEPGTYFLLVEPSTTTATTWTATVELVPAAPRNDGDACSTEVDITDTMASIPLSSLELDTGTGCGGTTSTSRDASFVVHVTTESDVLLDTNVGAIHFVSFGTACGDRSSELVCTSGTPAVRRRLLRVPPGDYHVTVATSLSSGTLVASATILPPTYPPTNDTCASPADLTDGVTFRGDLLAAADDVASCGGPSAVDGIHRLVLTEPRNVTIVARRTDGSGEPLHVGLRTDCSATSDLGCTTGLPGILNRTLDAGTHFVVVESAAPVAGPYSLTVYLADP